MLSLAPGSACDVCLEPFGHDAKAPHSIQCGHIFCLDCLNHITRLLCPLCRNEFEAKDFIKIHIDVDVKPTDSSPAENEARRLQEAIASVANAGTTEARLRQLIEEARTFLASQPRVLFQDLRVSHRMIAYLCDVKSRLRAQNQVVDGLNERLAEMGKEKADLEQRIDLLNERLAEMGKEKADLEQRIDFLVEKNKDEKETALAVETSLREHCSRANAAYEIMEDRYKFVVSEWERLNEEIKRLRSGSLSLESDPREHTIDVRCTLPDLTSLIPVDPPLNSEPMKLKGLNVNDQESYLISPLPEFTGRLPSSLESFIALPEVNDDLEKEIKCTIPDANIPSVQCGVTGHPLSCHCVPFPVFPEMPQSVSYESRQSASAPSRPPISEPTISVQPSSPVPAEPVPMPTPNVPRTPSGLSLTAPKSRELLGHSTSRSRSFSSRPSSRPPTRPSSPLLMPKSTTVQGQYTSSHDSSTVSPHLNIPHARDTEQLRTRLHNLLYDPNPNVSASLPNMSTVHFHSTDRCDAGHRDSTPRPSSRSSSSARPLPLAPKSVTSHPHMTLPSQTVPTSANPLIASNSSATTITTTATHHNPTPQRPAMVSHASSAALALEKAQRAEKERQRAEQEQERERERERRNSERGHEAEKPRRQPTPAMPGTPMGNSNSRREAKHIYAVSSGSSSSGSSFRRESSNSHVKSNMNSLRDSTNASVPQHQRYVAGGSGKSKIPTHLTSGSSIAGVYA